MQPADQLQRRLGWPAPGPKSAQDEAILGWCTAVRQKCLVIGIRKVMFDLAHRRVRADVHYPVHRKRFLYFASFFFLQLALQHAQDKILLNRCNLFLCLQMFLQ